MKTGEVLKLIGPNRRGERTVIEQNLQPEESELQAISAGYAALYRAAMATLEELGIADSELRPAAPGVRNDPLENFSLLFSQVALVLQRSAGHRVSQSGFSPDSNGNGAWVWFEYEHLEVGTRASSLALRLLAELEPAIRVESAQAGDTGDFRHRYAEFLDFARPLVMPLDTEALLAAALALDIPCVKLDRFPYTAVEGDFRIRPNSLLMLGHCAHRHIVDGTLCVTRNPELVRLHFSRSALRHRLSELPLPLPLQDPDQDNCSVARKAIRAAERIGYPVVVKPDLRGRGGVALNLQCAEEVRAGVEKARQISARVGVECMVSGTLHRLLMVNHQPFALLCQGQALAPDRLHESTVQLARDTSRHLDCGLLALDIVSTDIGEPLGGNGGAIVDLEVAPRLDQLLPNEPRVLAQAMEAFVHCLYPPGLPSRVPIVAVTGTNGKTTTCRMISRIMQCAGLRNTMVCSEGVYTDGHFSASWGELGIMAYHQVFERAETECVVLEEYFGHILRNGFSYSWNDVAVCTNVTEDHLGRIGTHSTEQMAAVKAEVLKRARRGVVLNADDPLTAAMAQNLTADRTALVSRSQGGKALQSLFARPVTACVVEPRDGKDWIVVHDGDESHPVLAVDDIPASFRGTAKHNVSNAMQAAAAAYLSGIQPGVISKALAAFEMSYENTPGRLNVFKGLPFRVIMDYAHNADGYRQLGEFMDQVEVPGSKIVVLAQPGDRRDEDIVQAVAVISRYFDVFVCRSYGGLRGREPGEIPELLKAGLLRSGIAEENIHVCNISAEGIDTGLQLARPGDVLVLLPGMREFATVWQKLELLEQQLKSIG